MVKINLETDEILAIIVDDACEFRVRGHRNEEGTMVLETEEL